MNSPLFDTSWPQDVDPEDPVSLSYQVALLSRAAALDTIAQERSSVVVFRHPVLPRFGPHDLSRRMFVTFSLDMKDHRPYEDIVEHVHHVHNPAPCAQSLVASWTRTVIQAEASSLNVALWPHYAYTQSRPQGDVVRRAYVVCEKEHAAIAVVPRHIIKYFRSGPGRILEDLGKRSPHDSPAVLETALGLYDPSTTGDLSRGRSALQAARLMHRS